MTNSIPRNEYPRPQMQRDRWLCLNGEWGFAFDDGDSGIDRGLVEAELGGSIVVPFCPESSLSGIGDVDFHQAVWYRRLVEIPADWAGERVILHFQACDYDTTVWVNGVEVIRHRGGFTPFSADITEQAGPGDTATIVVRARDDHRQRKASGKQAGTYGNHGCHYTRTTGIWQTVWLEPVPEAHLQRPRITPDLHRSRFLLEQSVRGRRAGMRVRAELSYQGSPVASDEYPLDVDFSATLELPVPADQQQLWEPGNGRLYDVCIELIDDSGTVIDRVQSYAGLRSVAIQGMAVLINGQPVFQRLVLDQGYYPDGIMTAPSDEALIADIELSVACGFNGARLHQKVFEERFLYHADRLGYLVWGEFADWPGNGVWGQELVSNASFCAQWAEAVERDYSHPAIIGWCPLNETGPGITDGIDELNDRTQAMYRMTKLIDRSRPCLDTSGWNHRVIDADIYDTHDYEQDPAAFRAKYQDLSEPSVCHGGNRLDQVAWNGQPYFISEFGGTWWNAAKAALAGTKRDESWGYGQRVRDIEEFYTRFEGLCGALLDHPQMFGYCYTQLTDVFQEENGVLHFDRSEKFDMARLHAAQQRPAAIEQQAITA